MVTKSVARMIHGGRSPGVDVPLFKGRFTGHPGLEMVQMGWMPTGGGASGCGMGF